MRSGSVSGNRNEVKDAHTAFHAKRMYTCRCMSVYVIDALASIITCVGEEMGKWDSESTHRLGTLCG